MEEKFWLNKWIDNEIGFHQDDYNPKLVRFWDELTQADKSPVLVPLCGKTRDMIYLRDKGHEVVGCEISRIAVESFFKDNKIDFKKSGQIYTSQDLTLYCCDILQIAPQNLERVEYVFDRAALIALPENMRQLYVRWLSGLPGLKKMMLVTIEFDNAEIGPPFSLSPQVIEKYYAGSFEIEHKEVVDIPLESNTVHAGQISWMKGHTYFLHKKSAS